MSGTGVAGEALRLAEAVRRAPFSVFVPAWVPRGAVMSVRYSAGSPIGGRLGAASAAMVSIDYRFPSEGTASVGLWVEPGGPPWLKLAQAAAPEPAPEDGPEWTLAAHSRDGHAIHLREQADWNATVRTLRVTRDGTRIDLTPYGPGLEEAMALAASLAPARAY